jgi:hypothetical protein
MQQQQQQQQQQQRCGVSVVPVNQMQRLLVGCTDAPKHSCATVCQAKQQQQQKQ